MEIRERYVLRMAESSAHDGVALSEDLHVQKFREFPRLIRSCMMSAACRITDDLDKCIRANKMRTTNLANAVREQCTRCKSPLHSSWD